MGKIFCFGELLLRYSPGSDGEWLNNNQVPVFLGGSEFNVAMALAKWQLPVSYCTALPGNFLATEIEHFIKSKNIDITHIRHAGKRIGSYYLQQDMDLKNSSVLYDRENSSFSELQTGMIDWMSALSGVSWFHFSAISPALNQNVAAVCKEGLEVASKKGIKISVDLNFRKSLWQYGRAAEEVMTGLVKYCDVVMGNIWSAKALLGIEVDELIEHRDSLSYFRSSGFVGEIIQKQFSKCRLVANTFRIDDHEGIKYFAALHSGNMNYFSPEFFTSTFASKVGTGDCFMAALIYGLYHHQPLQQVIDFAAAAAFGKLQERTDYTTQEIESIQETLNAYG